MTDTPIDITDLTWLRGVAGRFRTDARRGVREADAARSDPLPGFAGLVQQAEVAEKVTVAAGRLPESFRRAVLLRFHVGPTLDEIVTGDRVDTVRCQVRRGRELLREELVRSDGRDAEAASGPRRRSTSRRLLEVVPIPTGRGTSTVPSSARPSTLLPIQGPENAK